MGFLSMSSRSTKRNSIKFKLQLQHNQILYTNYIYIFAYQTKFIVIALINL